MTQLVEIPGAVNLTTMTRIFSLRGCHLLAMFARTHIAKEFRRWVLDVLETLNKVHPTAESAPTAPLTPDQQCTLQAVVKAKIESLPEPERSRGLYPQVWGRFNNHFRIARYAQRPQSLMSEALAYLVALDLSPAPKPFPKPPPNPT